MKIYRVHLTESERSDLTQLVYSGSYRQTKLKRAQILLGADESEGGKGMKDELISKAYDVSVRTIERTRQRFIEGGVSLALSGYPRSPRPPKVMDGKLEAHLVAMVCSDAPEGYERWSVRLLANTLIEKGYVDQISRETVRKTLKKMNLNPGKKGIM